MSSSQATSGSDRAGGGGGGGGRSSASIQSIDSAGMARLNAQVDVEKQTTQKVAAEFLRSEGLIQ